MVPFSRYPRTWRNGRMRERRFRCVFALVIAAFVLTACVATNLAPIGTGSGAFKPEADETQLWTASRLAEEKLAPQTALYQDDRLTTYLSGVVSRITPP